MAKAPKWTPEEQRRSDELVASCNTLKALHELQGRLIAELNNHGGPYGYGKGKVHVHLVFPEIFKQIVTSAEGMLSIAEHESRTWKENYPIEAPDAAERSKEAEDATRNGGHGDRARAPDPQGDSG